MNNIFVLDKNYNKIGTLSNQGVKPLAPYFNDLFVQELETGADTYEFSTISNSYTQGCIEIGNHIMFAYKNRNELFTITSIEYSHNEGYKTVGVYAEGVGFELLDIYMEKPKTSSSGNGNSGGNDSDGDGDNNTDDEYADPDDVYIDENGNIIYDKNGGTDYADPDDVTIDGNGNIIYKRSKRKDGTGDSLEFNNISYPTFIKMMLKNTGWSYVCQPGLESNKQDMRVSYDKNIYAILQDSMQTYKGVELEFRYEYNNGKVTKTVYAYNDGGRGSFVGKRFEYGTNVKGITKMQEVTHEKEDAILFVDNIGVEVTYDVDFALKSAEITDIEIGDTHYVIDSDFHPPMQIKARIGKIEISFSDPTRNKMYLANNKKIRGAVDEVEDIIDERIGDSESVPDHDHNRLVDNGTVFQLYGYSEEDNIFWPELSINYTVDSTPITEYILTDGRPIIPQVPGCYIGNEDNRWGSIYADESHCTETVGDEVRGSRVEAGSYFQLADNAVMENMNSISDSSDITKQDMYDFIVNKVKLYSYDFVNNLSHTFFGDYVRIDNMIGVSARDLRSTEIGKKWFCTKAYGYDPDGDGGGTFEYVCNLSNMIYMLLGAFQQHVAGGGGTSGPGSSTSKLISAEEIRVEREDGSAGQLDVFGKLYVTEEIKCELTTETNTLKVNTIEFSDGSELITAGNGNNGGTPGSYATVDYVNTYYATKEYVDSKLGSGTADSGGSNPDSGGSNPDSGGSNPGTGSSGDSTVFDTITVRKIIGPDRGEGQYNRVDFEDGIGVSHIFCNGEDENRAIFIGDHVSLHAGMTIFEHVTLEEDGYIEFPDGSRLTTANNSGSGGSSTDNITASKITIGNPTDSKVSKCSLAVKGNALVEGVLYIEGSYTVNGTSYSDKSLKENIRYIDTPTTYSDNSLLEKADLHDFIVNQVNICEYNFIDDDRNKIGFIANDYEGTKVGDKIVFRNEETDLLGYDSNNLLFATIGALQEEVRIRDEKIATLEARLAKIEALLGINNNDN